MKTVLWAGFIALLIAFQGSLLNPFIISADWGIGLDWGIRPDFILIAVYLFGLIKGDIRGGLFGAFLGFIMDVISAGPVYFNIFSKFFSGYLAGVIARWIQNPGVLLHGGLISGVSLLQGLGIFLALTFTGMAQFPGDLIYIAIPQALLDGISGGVAYLLLTYRKKEGLSRYASFMK